MNVLFTKIFQSLDVVGNVLLSFRRSGLDRIVDIYAFDTGQVQPCCLYFFFHCTDTLSAPYFARLRIVQCCDHTCHSRDLADLLQSYCVKFGSIPSQCHFHKACSSLS